MFYLYGKRISEFELLKPVKASHCERHHLSLSHKQCLTTSVLFSMAFENENTISSSRLYKGTANATQRLSHLTLYSTVPTAAASWHRLQLMLPLLRNSICFISLFSKPLSSFKLPNCLFLLSKNAHMLTDTHTHAQTLYVTGLAPACLCVMMRSTQRSTKRAGLDVRFEG